MEKLVIFSDAGIDDLIAIEYLIRIKKFDIKAIIATSGNMSTKRAYDVLHHFFGSKIKIYLGELEDCDIQFIHKGIEKIHIRIVENKVDLNTNVEEIFSDKLFVLSLSPLTTLARIIEKVEAKIIKIVIMGGAYNVAGNQTIYAEFNFYQDPTSVKKILLSNLKKILVPIDITSELKFKKHHIDIVENDDLKNLLNELLVHYYTLGENSIPLHDLTAAMFLTNPDAFSLKYRFCDIICEGDAKGKLIFDEHKYCRKKPNILILIDTEKTLLYYAFSNTFKY